MLLSGRWRFNDREGKTWQIGNSVLTTIFVSGQKPPTTNMSTQSLHQPAKEAKNAAAMAQDAEIVSSGANTSTSRPATPSTLDRLKGRFKRSFRSSTPKSTKEQVLPSPPNANQQSIESVVPNASLIVPVMDTPFKGTPDDRAREIEIYDRGIKVVAFLQELAGLTGPGLPNPVPSILKALTGVLTQLQVSPLS